MSAVTYLCNAESARSVRVALESLPAAARSLHRCGFERSTTSAGCGRATPCPHGRCPHGCARCMLHPLPRAPS